MDFVIIILPDLKEMAFRKEKINFKKGKGGIFLNIQVTGGRRRKTRSRSLFPKSFLIVVVVA